MALTPAIFAAGPLLETRYFPVVRDTEVLRQEIVEHSVIFSIRFRKVRQCEFLGLVWYHGEERLRIDFTPNLDELRKVSTRPTGGQKAGPWRLNGTDNLAGTRAFALHRCHPLWITISDFNGY